jgi:hypothetical protein
MLFTLARRAEVVDGATDGSKVVSGRSAKRSPWRYQLAWLAPMGSNPLKVRARALIRIDASRWRDDRSGRVHDAFAQLELKMRGVGRGVGLRAGR